MTNRSSKPQEARRRLEKEVKQKWLTKALKKEQLVRKGEAISEQEYTESQWWGEVVANEQMCRN